MEAVRKFRADYKNYGYEDQAIDRLQQTAEGFERDINLRINELDDNSSALVQLVRCAVNTIQRGELLLFEILCEAYIRFN